MVRTLASAALVIWWAAAAPSAQLRDFVPVGVVYPSREDAARERRDLEEMRRLRFNVIARGRDTTPLLFIDRLLAGAPFPGLPDPDLATAHISTGSGPEGLTIRAWNALAHGSRAIVFDDWAALQEHPGALAAASAFADAVTRNAGLYAHLRSDQAGGNTPDPKVDGDPDVHAHLLRSRDALVLIAINHSDSPQAVTIRLPPGTPEAIWRHMFTGGSVHLVTTARGVEYGRTFTPYEVLVLAIDTRRR